MRGVPYNKKDTKKVRLATLRETPFGLPSRTDRRDGVGHAAHLRERGICDQWVVYRLRGYGTIYQSGEPYEFTGNVVLWAMWAYVRPSSGACIESS